MDRSEAPRTTEAPAMASERARLMARGVCRVLADHGIATLTEFTLGSGRRVDVIGLDRSWQTTIVEIKTCLEDYRNDRKWPEYLAFCDRFYFAVPADFPRHVLPADCGLMAADSYGAVILRESPDFKLNAARRRAQGLRFGLAAAERLGRMIDPR